MINYLKKINWWLNNFNREWISVDFKYKGKKLHRKKRDKKIIYDANNARNRDSFSVTKANGMLEYQDAPKSETKIKTDEYEDMLIEIIDKKSLYKPNG